MALTKATLDTIETGGSLSNRNRIINGDCRVQQYSTSVSVPNNTTTYGGVDRYRAANISGGVFTQAASVLVHENISYKSIKQTVVTSAPNLSGTNHWSGITQTIEGQNCYDLIGKPITISFLFKASFTGVVSLSVRDSTTSFSYVTSFDVVADVPQKYVFVLPPIPASATIPNSNGAGLFVWIGSQNAGTLLTSTPNSWRSGNFIGVTGQTQWAFTSGASIEMTQLQLEEGSAATPYESKKYSDQLRDCEYYYRVGEPGVLTSYDHGGGAAGWQTSASWSFEKMRVVPTVGSVTWSTIQTTTPSIAVGSMFVYAVSQTTVVNGTQFFSNSSTITLSAEL